LATLGISKKHILPNIGVGVVGLQKIHKPSFKKGIQGEINFSGIGKPQNKGEKPILTIWGGVCAKGAFSGTLF